MYDAIFYLITLQGSSSRVIGTQVGRGLWEPYGKVSQQTRRGCALCADTSKSFSRQNYSSAQHESGIFVVPKTTNGIHVPPMGTLLTKKWHEIDIYKTLEIQGGGRGPRRLEATITANAVHYITWKRVAKANNRAKTEQRWRRQHLR